MSEKQIGEVLKSVVDFTSTQAPDVYEQILRAGMFSVGMCYVLGTLLFAGFVAVCIWSRREDEDIGYIIGGFVFLLALVVWGCGIEKHYKITKCPKAYVIEYISGSNN